MATLARQGTEIARLTRIVNGSYGPIDVYFSFRSNGRTMVKYGAARWKMYTRFGKMSPAEMAATIADLLTKENPWRKCE